MDYQREATAARVDVKAMANFLVLASVAAVLPFFIHSQWITGPIVNAILILTLFLAGIRSALVLALIPSVVALSSGLLPAVLAPAVPFIMIANAILVFTADWFYRNFKDDVRGYWLGVGAGALLKFLFLFTSVKIISGLLIKQELALKVAEMMGWPQLTTALTGGIIAWLILRWLKRI